MAKTKKVSREELAERRPVPLAKRKHNAPAKLRGSLTPGKIVILLAGPYRGKVSFFQKKWNWSGLSYSSSLYVYTHVCVYMCEHYIDIEVKSEYVIDQERKTHTRHTHTPSPFFFLLFF